MPENEQRATVEEARARIKHLVVLMFENRSFDHMLGYLNHPRGDEYPGIQNIPNPHDIANPKSSTVSISNDADYVLSEDPPHGHHSAQVQVHGVRWRRFRMDGFVTAYLRKLAGKEVVPVVHWSRIAVLLVALAVPLGATVRETVRRFNDRDWDEQLLWWILVYLVLGLSWQALARFDLLLARSLWSVFGLMFVAALVSAATTQGMIGVLNERDWNVVPWVFGVAIVLLGVLSFARSKSRQRAEVPQADLAESSERVMQCMSPGRIPVLATLAREFAVCTNWHSSVPGATWPNRNFLHAATSEDAVDIELGFYEATTIFERLGDGNWRIYHDGLPQVIAFPQLWEPERVRYWRSHAQLLADLAHHCESADHECLPQYSFVEPRHWGATSNSQHPGNNTTNTGGSTDFERGEELLWRIYNTLRDNPALFESTVLVVTYDEHGGFFDHVPPPRTVRPLRFYGVRRPKSFSRRFISWFVEVQDSPFDFRCLGMRVPTVIVSPHIPRGKIDDTLYDHTSVAATLRLLSGSFAPLTRRDARAKTFHHLVGASEPRPVPQIPAPQPPDLPHPPLASKDVIGEVASASISIQEPDRSARPGDDLLHQLLTLQPMVEHRLSNLGVPETQAWLVEPTPTERLAATEKRFADFASNPNRS